MEKITQRSVGFNLRQILCFAEYPDFNPDAFCRDAIDEQIRLQVDLGRMDGRFLKDVDN